MQDDLERIVGDVPGPNTRALTAPLRAHESRNVTYVGDDFPVFWKSASGATVEDVDGNRYIDLTAAFGVAAVGHSNPAVVAAIAEQAATLMHGMGDVHPTAVRTELLERLSRILPSGLTKTSLATTGSEAVEAALKTAVLATGKHRFVAYNGAYHGLSLGALEIGGIPKFTQPFAPLIADVALRLDYPDALTTTTKAAIDALRAALEAHDDIAAIVIEPIQGRGGCIVPPNGYLAALRTYCDARGILLVFDEIYTGFGRTGNWFACEHDHTIPDMICIGKAMGGGFPISAMVARAGVMDAWPASTGESLHTSTYLGNPMGCAAALATIGELDQNSAKFSLADRQVPIRVSLPEDTRRDLSTLENLPVPTANGGAVPLKAVADITFGQGPTRVRRYNQERRLTIVADLNGVELGTAMDKI